MAQKGKNRSWSDSEGIPDPHAQTRYKGDPIASVTTLTPRERAALVRTLVHRGRIDGLDPLEARIWSEIAHAVLRERRDCAEFIKSAKNKGDFGAIPDEMLEALAHLLESTRPHPLDNV